MAEIVAAALVSHAPLITGRPDVSEPARRERFYAGYRELGRRLHAARPDVIVMFVNDHLQNFPYSNMPAFCIGLAPRYDAPRGESPATNSPDSRVYFSNACT